MPILSPYQPVPSGLSFEPDTGPATPRKAYVLTPSGANVVITLNGSGVWAVDFFTSMNGVDFNLFGTKALPGQWRYSLSPPAAAFALRVNSFTSGQITAILAYGGSAPVTNVSPLFNAFLTFGFNATITEPPAAGQLRLNGVGFSRISKVWIHNLTSDGVDQFQALRRAPPGGTLLLQDKDNHSNAALYRIVGPAIDKTTYVEIPVVYQESTGGALAAALTLVAVFNPGPTLSLTPVVLPQLATMRPIPHITAINPPAAPLGAPNFTLDVEGYEFSSDNTIYWNGAPEPTTFVSSYELRTDVDMTTAQVAMPIPIEVRTADGLVSNQMTFDLGGTPPAEAPPSLAASAHTSKRKTHDG